MTFTAEQTNMLSAPLDPKHVASRSQAGRSLSYIEGWHAIAEANRIFGFDAWNRETIDLRLLGEPRSVDGKARVEYMARVRITVGNIVREGCGFGQGIDKDVGQAHESALKEAETDAMKRALMTFGNPFGLALYDKTQANVQAPAKETPTGPINNKTRDWVMDELFKRQIEPGELCRAFEVTNIKALTYERIAEVRTWINDYKKAA